MSKEIGTCHAELTKLQTTIDGGARITLDIGSHDFHVIKNLLDKYSTDGTIVCAFVDGDNE